MLIHFNNLQVLFFNLDTLKEFRVGGMVYHIKNSWVINPEWFNNNIFDVKKASYPPKTLIQLIMFLSR